VSLAAAAAAAVLVLSGVRFFRYSFFRTVCMSLSVLVAPLA
jgi:hypothetical protein